MADVQEDAILATLKDDGEQETPKESSPKEQPEEVKSEEPEKAEEKEITPEPDKSEEDPKEPEVPEVPEAKEDKPTKADERKTQLNTEIRDLVSQRNALKVEVEKANAEVYQPAEESELTGQPKDPNDPQSEVYTALEARVEAMRQQQEMDKYNTAVAEAQLTISHESNKVLDEFSWANPDKPGYDQELAEEAAALLDQNLVRDPNTGQIIASNISPYQLYKTIDRAHQSSTVKGQIQGREATESMLANADSPGNAAPLKKEKDPVLEILKSDDY